LGWVAGKQQIPFGNDRKKSKSNDLRAFVGWKGRKNSKGNCDNNRKGKRAAKG
jgi:hypothetical protein